MAIRERLLKQLNIVRDGLHAMPPFHSRDLQRGRTALVQARDLCFQGLPSGRFSDYQDTYDGILFAIDQLATGAVDGQEIASLCQELLQYLSVQTQKETAFKKEIFFLPYKASMWDSLETVWKAANEDKEHCIAYVMPIPYADLTPEHTVAEWHCEKDIFPKDVPTVDWQTVDLEEMHPDVIFIHNPYDEYNHVTSVESRYYSRNLKKCTDKLVYIPYFVLEEPCSEGGVENFATTPGVLNADKVIVQSEVMRELYINILIKKTNQKDRAYWEDRISGAGSPKIDKVITSRKEDFEMPEKWKRLVEGRKVILYNTSLSAMLQNSDKVCDKLRYVFDFFRDRDDVVLWWRPHPLMKATFHSMRPQFEEEYLSLEKQYVEEGWGIYDDSPDLHRAICWSDAYYGDGSSVRYLYETSYKPIMIQQMEPISIGISDIVEVEDEFIFSAFNINGLFSYKKREKELRRVAVFEEYPYTDSEPLEIIYKTKLIGDIVFLFPYFGKDIYCYDLTTKRLSKWNLSSNKWNTDGKLKRFLPTWHHGDLWIMQCKGGDILQIGKRGEILKVYCEWQHILSECGFLPTSELFFTEPICDNDFLWFAVSQTNCVIKFSMKNGEAEIFHIGNGKFISLTFDGMKIWLYTLATDLYWFDVISKEYGVIKHVLPIGNGNYGNTILYRKGVVYAFSEYSTDYAMISTKTLDVSVQKGCINRYIRTSVKMENENIFILPIDGDCIVKIPLRGEPETFNIVLSKEDEKFYRRSLLNVASKHFIKETSFCKLRNLIEADFLFRKGETTKRHSEIGREILRDIKEVL